jgi:isoquinoline 1-oxidoreductase alpha subunit
MLPPCSVTIHVNGKQYSPVVSPEMPLLWVLRDVIGLTGTKYGCGIAQCGACTVHLAGNAIRSCVTAVGIVGDSEVTTIEGLEASEIGRRLQSAWLRLQVPQCGYCQSGQLMSASALLARTPQPTDVAIDLAMSGNICRCCTYPRIRAAIHAASQS